MSSSPIYWNKLRPVSVLENRLTLFQIPQFDILFGEVGNSLFFNPDGATGTKRVTSQLPNFPTPTSKFQIDCWVKPLFSNISQVIGVLLQRVVDATDRTWVLYINGNLNLGFELTKVAATPQYYISLQQLKSNEWNHVAICYDGTLANGNVFTLWVNGEKTNFTISAGNRANLYAGALTRYDIGGENADPVNGRFYLDELRIWSEIQPDDYFLRKTHAPRRPDNTFDTDTTLKVYFKFNELSSTSGYPKIAYTSSVSADVLDGTAATLSPSVENYPYSLGCSYIVGIFDLSSIGQNFSFKFPVEKPETAEGYSLSVLWMDEDGNPVRRFFWINEDLMCSSDLVIYSGEPILFENAVLEVWNDNFAIRAVETTGFNLEISVLQTPTSYTDKTQQSVSPAVTVDEDIYAHFPLVFPITFDQAK